MPPNFTSLRTGRVFYGWFALTGAIITIFVFGGTFMQSFGVFLPVICAEFGWSRAAVASALSLGTLAFGLPSPLWGVIVNKFGPRLSIVLGQLLAVLAFAGLSLIQEIWHIYLLYIIIGLGGGFGGFIAATTVANNWFIRRRSLALGLCSAAGALGAFIYPPLATALLSSIGWRMSWLLLAGIVLTGSVLVGGIILIRNRPEDMGQVPDGISTETFVDTGTVENLSKTGEGQVERHLKQILQMPTTWLIGVFTTANSLVLGAMTTHQIAYMRDIGFNAMTAATTLSLMAVMSIISSLAFGILAIRLNIRYMATVSFIIQLMALSILLTTRELALLYIYSVLLGLSIGALVTAMPTFVSTYFGHNLYSQAMGIIFPFHVIPIAIAAVVVGAIYDATTTYTLGFFMIAAFSFIGLICAFMARQPKMS